MKRREDENRKYVSIPKELLERLLESRVGTTGSIIKQSIIDHTVKYVIIGLLIIGLGTGGYYYFINPTVEKIEKSIEKVEDKYDDFTSSKIFHPSQWFSSDTNKTDTNKTEEIIKVEKLDENKTSFTDKIKGFFSSDDNTNVDSVDENISDDTNKTSFLSKAKSWFSWSDKNSTKEVK